MSQAHWKSKRETRQSRLGSGEPIIREQEASTHPSAGQQYVGPLLVPEEDPREPQQLAAAGVALRLASK
jgi:hypothetical protein